MQLEQVRAVLTGGASGLGAACVEALCRAGAHVVACDVDTRALRELARRYAATGRVFCVQADVADEADVRRLLDEADAALGGVNVLVNNAGILRDGVLAEPGPEGVRTLPTGLWQRVLAVNLTGAFFMAREAAARMLARRAPGLIVNISSLARSGNAGQSAYAASKAGLDACTRSWALELGAQGIRVVGIAPGVFETPMLEHVALAARQRILGGAPLGRFGKPEELWPVLRLAIESDYITGRTLEIDGGGSLEHSSGRISLEGQ